MEFGRWPADARYARQIELSAPRAYPYTLEVQSRRVRGQPLTRSQRNYSALDLPTVMITAMADTIDLSTIPPAEKHSARFGFFGTPLVPILVVIILAALAAISAIDTKQFQNAGALVLVALALLFIWIMGRRNDTAERATMRAFARANGWTYEDRTQVESATLPVAGDFSSKKVARRFRIAGDIAGHPFELYEVHGYDSDGALKGWVDRTVLVASGTTAKGSTLDYLKATDTGEGVLIILKSNALTRDDISAMFQAAGLI